MIAVAVSGGVDSLYALASLKARGEDVFALHARFHALEAKADPVPGLLENCEKLGVELCVAPLEDAFRERVMRPFAESYAAGETPNPCAMCNAGMKFGLLADIAMAHGADSIATGHYARKAAHPRYGWALVPPADSRKDQSYFLALTPGQRLERALFPLEGVSKDQARAFVEARGLRVPLPRESQEICFVPADDYRRFVGGFGLTLSGPGPVEIVLPSGVRKVVGRHNGLWRHTEGQRRGLGIAWSEPLYVTGKERRTNTLLVGTARALARCECEAGFVNALVEPSLWPERMFVRVRYRQKAAPAHVVVEKTGAEPTQASGGLRLRIVFDEPQTVAAPGQVAAVYDEAGAMLAGGVLL